MEWLQVCCKTIAKHVILFWKRAYNSLLTYSLKRIDIHSIQCFYSPIFYCCNCFNSFKFNSDQIKPFKFRAQLIYKCLLHRSVYGITILKETKIVKVHCSIDLNYLTEHQAQRFYVYDCCITFPYCLCFLQQMIT